MFSSLLFKGFVLGWSVAWPPGPINAQMMQRGLAHGFWPAWALGLGACTGDFCWAVAVSLGAGALIGVPGVRTGLGILSVTLLLFLAWAFGGGAWRAWQARGTSPESPVATPARRFDSARGGFFLGLTLALTSPWNIAFWLAVIGSQAGGNLGLTASLLVAGGVTSGAASYSGLFCAAVRLGARFATPIWLVVTQGATALLMLYFAVTTLRKLAVHA